MKSEKGITLTSLVIYVLIATVAISGISMVASVFLSNMDLVKDQDQYAPEINYFNMYFIEDIKKNKTATVSDDHKQITFADGAKYQYKAQEKAIYRNDIKISEKVNLIEFLPSTITVKNTEKQIIKVKFSFGDNKTFEKEIEYVLKYW